MAKSLASQGQRISDSTTVESTRIARAVKRFSRIERQDSVLLIYERNGNVLPISLTTPRWARIVPLNNPRRQTRSTHVWHYRLPGRPAQLPTL
jgi:hypothetical protein